MSSRSLVVFAGSRGLGSSSLSLVSPVVRTVLRAGFGVSVGCSRGADALVLSAFFAVGGLPSALSVFAVGGSSGRGSWRGSTLGLVRRAASAGARVFWCSGGPLSFSLPRRLRSRSCACVRSAGGRCAFVAFVSGGFSASRGSWAAARVALHAGLPVVVFPVGCSVSRVPAFDRSWVSAGSGVWSRFHRWGIRWFPRG